MAEHKAYLKESAATPLKEVKLRTPTPTGGQLLVEVLATRILHYTKKQSLGFPAIYPLVPGGGAIGRVVAVGEPNSTGFLPGMLVACDPTVRARDDPSGHTIMLQGFFSGISEASNRVMRNEFRHGAWAQKMLIPVENATVLDEDELITKQGYSIPQLTLIGSLVIPLGGFEKVGLKAGEQVIVAPATGHIGGGAVLVALALGASKVIVLGKDREALQYLASLDPLKRIHPVPITSDAVADTASILRATQSEAGVDVYFDISPPEAGNSTHLKSCFDAVKPGGRVVLMGGIPQDISFNYATWVIKGITVAGQFMYSRETVTRCINLVTSGLLNIKSLNTHAYGWEKLEQCIDEAVQFNRITDTAVFMPNEV